MAELLLSTAVVAAAVAVGLALLAAVTLVPFVLALRMAEARRLSANRWGAVALAGSALGLLLVLALLRTERLPDPAALLPLAADVPRADAACGCSPGDEAVGGRAGRHEG